jgi:hypothetical protein
MMKHLILIQLFLLLQISCIAQNNNDLIKADLFFVQTQYGYETHIEYERGLIINVVNMSDRSFYLEDGMTLASYLLFTIDNKTFKITDFRTDPHYSNIIDDAEPGKFEHLMLSGNGFNNLFNKQDNLLEYASDLLLKQMHPVNSKNKTLTLRKSTGIIYLKPYSCYSMYVSLNDCKLTRELSLI